MKKIIQRFTANPRLPGHWLWGIRNLPKPITWPIIITELIAEKSLGGLYRFLYPPIVRIELGYQLTKLAVAALLHRNLSWRGIVGTFLAAYTEVCSKYPGVFSERNAPVAILKLVDESERILLALQQDGLPAGEYPHLARAIKGIADILDDDYPTREGLVT